MSTTKIEWTRGADGTPGKVWNPVRGCAPVSAGCKNCYAARFAHRFSGEGGRYEGLTKMAEHGPVWNGKVLEVPEFLEVPLRWRKPRRIFVNSMSDLFHEDVSFEFIAAVFGVMAVCRHHTFQILTKRPKRMKEWFEWAEKDMQGQHKVPTIAHHAACVVDNHSRKYADQIYQAINKMPFWYISKGWPLPHVWIGVSVENQAAADDRLPILLSVPAAVHWVSLEPLLGLPDLALWLPDDDSMATTGGGKFDPRSLDSVHAHVTGGPVEATGIVGHKLVLDWVVLGGESGQRARPMDPDWVRSIRDQCQQSGTPFLFKQWGEWKPHVGAEEVAPGAVIDMPLPSVGRVHVAEVEGRKYEFRGVDSSWMRWTGKQAAGRELDGRIWDEYPCR